MPTDASYKDYVVSEVLQEIEGITTRAMFGGWGIYKDGLFFALIADGVLYFKVDDTNRADYEKAGSEPFVYVSPQGKEMTMGYYELPSSIMEDREAIKDWVNSAHAVALGAKAQKEK